MSARNDYRKSVLEYTDKLALTELNKKMLAQLMTTPELLRVARDSYKISAVSKHIETYFLGLEEPDQERFNCFVQELLRIIRGEETNLDY